MGFVKRGINKGIAKGGGGKNLKPYVTGRRSMNTMAFFAKLNAEGLYEPDPKKRDTARATERLNDTRDKRTRRSIDMNRKRALKYQDDMSSGLGMSITPTKSGSRKFKGQGSSESKWDRDIRETKTSNTFKEFKKPRKKIADVQKKVRFDKFGEKIVTKTKPKVDFKTQMQVGTKTKKMKTRFIKKRQN